MTRPVENECQCRQDSKGAQQCEENAFKTTCDPTVWQPAGTPVDDEARGNFVPGAYDQRKRGAVRVRRARGRGVRGLLRSMIVPHQDYERLECF